MHNETKREFIDDNLMKWYAEYLLKGEVKLHIPEFKTEALVENGKLIEVSLMPQDYSGNGIKQYNGTPVKNVTYVDNNLYSPTTNTMPQINTPYFPPMPPTKQDLTELKLGDYSLKIINDNLCLVNTTNNKIALTITNDEIIIGNQQKEHITLKL